jgi:TPR repeat protein
MIRIAITAQRTILGVTPSWCYARRWGLSFMHISRPLTGALIAVTLHVSMAMAGPLEDGAAAGRKGDYATALRLFLPLAEQGKARAQAALGFLYYNGFGVPKDYAVAAEWNRKAAEQGNALAQSALGLQYFNGFGVPKDYAVAAEWNRKAAEQGDAGAQLYLSFIYGDGLGVPKDYVLAYMWANLAASRGSEDAKKSRDLLEPLMTPDQIAEAQRLAREWKPRQ